MKKTLIMLLTLMQQPNTSGNFVQDTLGSMITAHPYGLAITTTVVAAGAYGWNWWTYKHQDRYVLDPQALPAPDKNAAHVNLFLHGAFDSGKQALQLVKREGSDAPYIFANNVITFDFDDSFAHSRLPFWCFKGCFGQAADVALVHTQVEHIEQQYPNLKGMVMHGISRGASAIINYHAEHGTGKTVARILESPFDSIERVVATRAAKLGLSASVINVIKPLLLPLLAGRYCSDGMQPIEMIKKNYADIPTLIIAVENDHAVPLECTINLYKGMKEQGATRTYLYVLKAGRHGKLIQGPEGNLLQDVEHAFLKHFGLDHDPVCAERGAAEFERILNA